MEEEKTKEKVERRMKKMEKVILLEKERGYKECKKGKKKRRKRQKRMKKKGEDKKNKIQQREIMKVRQTTERSR